MRTPVFGFGFSKRLVNLGKMVADLATDLFAKLAVIEVKKLGRRLAVWTRTALRYGLLRAAMLHRRKRISVSLLKGDQPLFPIFRWLTLRLVLKGSERIYIEVPVVRMFFLKSSLGLTSGLRLASTPCSSKTIRSICSRSNFEQIQMTKRDIRSISFLHLKNVLI